MDSLIRIGGVTMSDKEQVENQLTPEQANFVIKAIAEAERREAEAQAEARNAESKAR
jgi:hypothetical protein